MSKLLMKSSPSRSFWSTLRRDLPARWRLLAAAFGRSPIRPSTHASPAENDAQIDLLAGLNTAAETAGVQAWDWDVERNTLKFNRNVARFYGADADAAETNPRAFMEQAIHPEDLPRYRDELHPSAKRPARPRYSISRQATRRRDCAGSTSGRSSSQHVWIKRWPRDTHRWHHNRHVITSAAAAHIESQAKQRQALLDRITLANETANVGMWDWDLTTGALASDTNMAAIFKDVDLSGVTRAEISSTILCTPTIARRS